MPSSILSAKGKVLQAHKALVVIAFTSYWCETQ